MWNWAENYEDQLIEEEDLARQEQDALELERQIDEQIEKEAKEQTIDSH